MQGVSSPDGGARIIGTHRAGRERESRTGDGAAQVVVGVAVTAGKVRAVEARISCTWPEPSSKCRATQQSTMLQSGWGKR